MPEIGDVEKRKLEAVIDMPGVDAIPEVLQPLITPATAENPSWLAKFRGVWAVLQVLVEHLVQAAETIYGAKTGDKKKEAVTAVAMRWLKEAEKKVDFIPNWLQPIAFRAIEFGVDMMVEKVVKALLNRDK